MNVWDTLNSPFVVAVVSFLLGGLVVSAISAAWQRRAHAHELRLDTSKEIVHTYHEYISLLRRPPEDESDRDEAFDRIHSMFLSRTVMARVIFDESVSAQLRALARKLANVKNLQIDGKEVSADKQLMSAYTDAEAIVETMFKAIR